MKADEFNERGRHLLGRSYLTIIGARLRVSAHYLDAWAEGRAEIPEAKAAAIEALFIAQASADELVARWMARLLERAGEAGLTEEDVTAALARRPGIAAACASRSESARTQLGRGRRG